MEEKSQHEYLMDANNRIYEQLTYAETKHAVLIGLLGASVFAIIGIVIDLSGANLKWLQILLGCVAALMFLPLIVSIVSFFPNRRTLEKSKNLYFYGDVGKYKNSDTYLNDVNSAQDLDNHLARQNIVVSKIITKKHDKFVLALHLCLASIFPLHYIGTLIITIIKIKSNK